MTFKDYMNQEVGFGNFTREELLSEDYLNMKFKDWLNEIEKAFEAGWDSCRDHWGGMDYKETIKDGFMKEDF